MEDNNKLFVFEKKEVILIFIFIVLIAIISFTLGVRTGKQLSLKHDDYTEQDVENIELKSIEEEKVDGLIESDEIIDETNETSKELLKESSLEKRLKEEMQKLAAEKVEVTEKKSEIKKEAIISKDKSNEEAFQEKDHTGKFTIQVFSHQNKELAQEFADGFTLKGHEVIINEVIIPGKGTWYRVGIGLFDNVNLLKDYLKKEEELFQGQKYLIRQI